MKKIYTDSQEYINNLKESELRHKRYNEIKVVALLNKQKERTANIIIDGDYIEEPDIYRPTPFNP